MQHKALSGSLATDSPSTQMWKMNTDFMTLLLYACTNHHTGTTKYQLNTYTRHSEYTNIQLRSPFSLEVHRLIGIPNAHTTN